MVEKEDKHSLNVTFDQHEAIINMKHGRDTVYDVMDRLIAMPEEAKKVDRAVERLELSMLNLCNIVGEATLEMRNTKQVIERCLKKQSLE